MLQTPLHLSAEHGLRSNVSLLLQHEANMLLRDSNGMTACDLADKAGHVDCTAVLKEAAGELPSFLCSYECP